MDKIFLDFDGTIVNSVKSFCDVYNWGYSNNPNFKKADWAKVNKWNFSDECPLAKDNIEDIFASDAFFLHLDLMNENTLEVISRLKEKFDIIVCSIGTPGNISRKVGWIENILDIKDMVMLSKEKADMGKSIVDMSGAILVDDHQDNLITSNADIKICFGETKEWNKCWKGLRVKDWTELEELLNDISQRGLL